ncbi:MAG: penicillin acylase family protein [Bdellovibrionales bacterium]
MLRLLIKVLAVLIVLVLLTALGYGAWVFYRSQPVYSGNVSVPGIMETVRVYRDPHGVPHIFAGGMNDAARALGYIHASERLFQMEMQRRAGAGRLSEIFGEDTLDVDRFVRTLGFYRLAQKTYDNLSPASKELMDAYAAGVNAWLAAHKDKLPPEFFILRLMPEEWKPADSLVWAKLMALQLSANYRREILRLRLAQKFSPEQIEQLIPPPPPESPVTTMPKLTQAGALPVPEKSAGVGRVLSMKETRIEKTLDQLGQITSLTMAASNEWVVAGTRTESGKPILANDPHLGLEAPVLWYLARIVTPDGELKGATVPGLPVVLLGQNDRIAWGFTTTDSDVQDLFIETVDPGNPQAYMAPGGPFPFSTDDEIIRVKDRPDVTLTVRRTRHGPVLSDIDPELAALAGDGKAVALSFTALNETDATPEALVRLNRANNWQDFLNALQLYTAPPQNIVYADIDGNIGFLAAGAVPVRKSGNGLMPADGASGDHDWTGTIPPQQAPQLFNPPAGFVFNANNAIVDASAAYYYGRDWEEPFRAERLQQIFDGTAKHNMESTARMQADHVSLAARQLLPFLLNQKFVAARDNAALDMLKHWDGTMDRDLPAPLIFEAWMHELHKLLITEKTGDPMKPMGPYNALAMRNILAAPGGWCAPAPNCDEIVKQAFGEALVLLTARNGGDMNAWHWGDEHRTVLKHKFFSHLPVLDKYSELSAGSSGDFYTLDRGGSSAIDPEHPFMRTHGGGYRGIYDLGDPGKSRFMIASGQSGHILSPHYRDLFGLWNEVQSFTLAGDEGEMAVQNYPVLVFESNTVR